MTDRNGFVNFKVKDFMTPDVITVNEEEKVIDIWSMFEKYHISAVAVMNMQAMYVGVFSKTDFFKEGLLEILTNKKIMKTLKVKEIVTHKPLITVDEDTLEEACDLMLSKHIHRVFVQNKKEKVIGVLSSYDVMKVLATCATINEMNLMQNKCTLCGTIL
jgi:predicted transcriptional regulator